MPWIPALLGLAMGLGFAWATTLQSDRFLEADATPGIELPTQVASILDQASDPLDRVAQLARLFDQNPAGDLSPDAFRALRSEIEWGGLLDGDVEYALFAAWWARLDAPAAYAWSQMNPQGGSPRVYVALFEEWAKKDALVAIDAATTDYFAARRQRSLAASLIGVAGPNEERQQAFAAALASIEDRTDRRAALSGFVESRLMSEGVESAVAQVRRRSASLEPEAADDLAAGAAVVIAQQDPRSAVALLGPTLDAGRPLPAGTARDVASAWDDRDPLATIEWLGSLATNQEQTEAVRLAFQSWLTKDRATAMSWAKDMIGTTEEWLQPVRVSYGFNLGHVDRQRGLEVLLSIPGDSQQARFIRHIFSEWREEDPIAAEAWLEAAELGTPFKNALRKFKMRFPHRMTDEMLEDIEASAEETSGGGR
jgi:hypothetical protein